MVRVEVNHQIIEGNPDTLEITAYQRRFYAIVRSEPEGYENRRTFVPDPYESLADVNSDPDVHREFESAIWRKGEDDRDDGLTAVGARPLRPPGERRAAVEIDPQTEVLEFDPRRGKVY